MKITKEMVMESEKSLSAAVSDVLGYTVEMKIEEVPPKYELAPDVLLQIGVEGILPRESLGVSRFIFLRLSVGSFGFFNIFEQQGQANHHGGFELHFDYEHQRHGSNGCGAGFCEKRICLYLTEKADWNGPQLTWVVKID